MLCDVAKNLAFEGRFGTDVFGNVSGFPHAYYWQPPLYPLIMAGVYRVAGFGMLQTRIPGLIFGAMAIFLLMLLIYRLTGDMSSAFVGGSILLIDPVFIQTARAGRMDTLAIMLILLGLYMFIVKKKDFLSGVFIGLAGISHPIVIEVFLAMVLLIFIKEGFVKTLRFISGAFIPLIPWIIYILIHPDYFSSQFLMHGIYHIKAGFFSSILGELKRYIHAYRYAPFIPIIFLMVIITALKKPMKYLSYIILFSIPLIFNTFLMVKGMGYYTLYPELGGLLLTGLVAKEWNRKIIKKVVLPVLILTGLLTMGSRLYIIISQWNERDYTLIYSELKDIIKLGDYVWGPGEAWYGVIEAGGRLQITGDIDPERHRVVIVNPWAYDIEDVYIPPEYRFVRRIGSAIQYPRLYLILNPENRMYLMDLYILSRDGG